MEKLDLMNLLYSTNIYKNFDKSGFNLDLQGWGSTRSIFHKMINKVKPKLIIEVGTWKGASAIYMASYIKKNKLDCKILCIDTWLGSVEMWAAKDHEKVGFWYTSLKHKNGYPMLYYQFLYNVIAKKMQNIIIPFPNTSANAYGLLEYKKIKADLIYIDGSHEYGDVYVDIKSYYKLLNKKGVIFGDDYNWPGVKKAVNTFVKRNKLKLELVEKDIVWIIKKNGSR